MKDIEVVIHLAARAHVMSDQSSDPLSDYRRVNVDGTVAIANAARQSGIKRLIFLSSIKVNGERTLEKPYTAHDTPAPEDPYGISKSEAESRLIEVSKDSELETVIVRTPLVYGAGVRANFLSLMSIADSGLPLPFGAINKNRRSLIYIENLVDLLIKTVSHPSANGQTLLVCDGEDLSTTSLVENLRTSLGRKRRLVPIPPAIIRASLSSIGKSGMADRLLGSLVIDDTATRELLKWQPPFTIAEGLRRTADWYRASNAQ